MQRGHAAWRTTELKHNRSAAYDIECETGECIGKWLAVSSVMNPNVVADCGSSVSIDCGICTCQNTTRNGGGNMWQRNIQTSTYWSAKPVRVFRILSAQYEPGIIVFVSHQSMRRRSPGPFKTWTQWAITSPERPMDTKGDPT